MTVILCEESTKTSYFFKLIKFYMKALEGLCSYTVHRVLYNIQSFMSLKFFIQFAFSIGMNICIHIVSVLVLFNLIWWDMSNNVRWQDNISLFVYFIAFMG